jgi:hypothetical protein
VSKETGGALAMNRSRVLKRQSQTELRMRQKEDESKGGGRMLSFVGEGKGYETVDQQMETGRYKVALEWEGCSLACIYDHTGGSPASAAAMPPSDVSLRGERADSCFSSSA